MKNYLINKHFFAPVMVLAVPILLTNPALVSAANVFPATTSPTVSSGSVFIVDIKLNTEGENINTVEGQIEVNSGGANYKLVDILLGGSDLSLWPEKPSLTMSGNNSKISFTGGSTSGIKQSDALVMKLAIQAIDAGMVEIKPTKLVGYIHDGQGSSTQVSASATTVRIVAADETTSAQDSLKDLVKSDNTPPEPFEINIGQDPSLYDGKKFISFFAVDAESGISHYEVKEGDRTAVRSGTTYVLQDQELKSKITVAAYDKAGNSRVMTWDGGEAGFWSKLLGRAIVIVVSILALVGIWFVFKTVKKIWLARKSKTQ